ncbi:MAG TPA: DUF3379 family protein [Steroidobacteraceae bacterium]|jgi:anti-sigma factor RsiW|nr:DUF3379 family protein [Steroidobacteraceae bacterium]
MDCAEFRRELGTDPKRSSPELEAHRASCPACARYAADMQRIDQLLLGALPVKGPASAASPWKHEPRRHVARWVALAAGVLVAAVGLTFAWRTQERRDALITEVVRHADREANVLVPSEKRVSTEKLQKALAKAGAQLAAELPVSVARICKVRGEVAPHLIMQTREGAVAVLVLAREHTWLPHSFAEQGYQGRLLPKDGHAIAIIGTSAAAVKAGAELASGAIEWPK